uniref:Uncharacterized protein n=1 Tax=Brassica campestris TaxID=3711 RepID=M4FIX3_BRACM
MFAITVNLSLRSAMTRLAAVKSLRREESSYILAAFSALALGTSFTVPISTIPRPVHLLDLLRQQLSLDLLDPSHNIVSDPLCLRMRKVPSQRVKSVRKYEVLAGYHLHHGSTGPLSK